MHYSFKINSRRFSDGSRKCFPHKEEDLRTYIKCEHTVYDWNPCTRDTETGDSWDLLANESNQVDELHVQGETLIQKNKLKNDEENIWHLLQALKGTCTQCM